MPRLTKTTAKPVKAKPTTLVQVAIAALEDMKAIDVKVIDVMKLTTITDHMIVCTGTSNRHVKSLADNVIQMAKDFGNRPIGIEGIEQGEWVLVDLGGVVVHVMQVQARAFYQLERLWDVAPPEPQEAPKAIRGKAPLARAGLKAKKMGKLASKGSAGKAALKPAKRVKPKSEDKPASRSAARSADKPKKSLAAGRKFVTKGAEAPAAKKTVSKSAAKPAFKSSTKPAASKAGFKPSAKPASKPSAKSASKPTSKAGFKSGAKSAFKSSLKPAAKPAAKKSNIKARTRL
ncbi:MAG: ribosome silencing factor [Pseudomonadota bacterium]